MATKIVNKEKAFDLAVSYRPVIYQEFKDVKDLLVPFMFGEPKDIEGSLGNHINRPTLYFGAREDNEHFYVYYLVYHAFDWSSSSIGFINRADSHQHDTESILMRAKKCNVNDIDICTVSHFMFHFETRSNKTVSIEAETHAIKPINERPPRGNFMVYKIYDLINLNEFSQTQWKTVKNGLGGHASMPQEQYDSVFRSGSHGRKFHKKGDIFLRPDKVFEIAKKKGRI